MRVINNQVAEDILSEDYERVKQQLKSIFDCCHILISNQYTRTPNNNGPHYFFNKYGDHKTYNVFLLEVRQLH